MPPIPSYLQGYETQYAADPRGAARAWFAEAHFGLFMHYGLYSQLGRGEWVMLRERIPVAEYVNVSKSASVAGDGRLMTAPSASVRFPRF